MALSVHAFGELYERMAPAYDQRARLFHFVGFREVHYKRQTIAALDLKPGDTVVDIGCGTGLNFPLLLEKVGATGKIIGVDLTPGMLVEAARRIEHNGWVNVELVQSDAAKFTFPPKINAVLSTFALTFVPGFETVIANGFSALKKGGTFAVLDMKKSERWPAWLVRLAVKSAAPFGVTLDLSDRKPWEVLRRYSENYAYTEFFAGFIYSTVVTKA